MNSYKALLAWIKLSIIHLWGSVMEYVASMFWSNSILGPHRLSV